METRCFHNLTPSYTFRRILFCIQGFTEYLQFLTYCWLWRPHCICLEENSIRRRPKDFEASGSPCYILNNTHFFWNQSPKSKNFIMSGKVETFSKQNGICRGYLFLIRIMYTKLQSYSLCCRQTKWYMQKIPFVTWIKCAKNQNYNIYIHNCLF